MKKKVPVFRAAMAVVFGIMGFWANFNGIELLQGTPFKVSPLLGLFFPLLIALAWGWRWGLVCALAGGCQSMWWLWMGDGWGVLYAVPVFTLWIVWHGWWVDRRRFTNQYSPFTSPFVVEIPIRIAIEVGFFTVFPWLVAQNPPPWDPAIVWHHVSPGWIKTVAVKHAFTAYVLLLAAYVTLSLKPVRRFFGIPPLPEEHDTTAIFAGAMFMSSFLWTIDALAHCLLFQPQSSFLESLVFRVAPQALFSRILFVLIFLMSAIIVARLNRQRMAGERRLNHLNRVLAAVRNVNQLITQEKDKDRLLDQACHMMVESRGYYNCWIALTESGRPVAPFYRAGFNGAFQPMDKSLCAGQVPYCAELSLCHGGVQLVKEPVIQCSQCHLAAFYGGRAALTVRLEHQGRVLGWLSVSVAKEMASDAEEQSLLAEVSGDISFALWSIEMEEERRSAEKKYATLLNNLSEAVLATDLDGNIELFNPGAERLFGCSAKEAMGSSVSRFCPENLLSEQNEIQMQVLAKGPIQGKETERITANGRRISVDITVDLNKDENGRATGFSAIIRDISDRKQMERENIRLANRLQQAQKMEALGSLAGGIAHDFNNLLFPIVGLSEMLLEDLPPESSEYCKVQDIFSAGQRGSELVKQILAFSRQSEHKLVPVAIQEVLQDVVKLCRSTIPKNILIDADIQQECALVVADPNQIHQVAMNLIANAYHAVEGTNGRIELRLIEKDIDQTKPEASRLKTGVYVAFSVIDNGPGIAPEILNRIFEPYFTTKTKGKGTGLGLATAFGIVKEHHGVILVESQMGNGTAFHVYLPAMNECREEANDKSSVHLKTGNERILVVDDEEPIAMLEKQLLERLGYRVEVKFGSKEALEEFRLAPEAFDLVITDMSMPGMTGEQLAQHITSTRPNLPVIVCSGFSEQIDRGKQISSGIQALLNKPILKMDLANTVRRVLDAVG